MANEKRLIDANALWEKFEAEPWYDNADRDEIALPMVLDAPTVDAVEVAHGRWILKETWGKHTEKFHCSVCNKVPKSLCVETYCPNCGAKMDGGNEDV